MSVFACVCKCVCGKECVGGLWEEKGKSVPREAACILRGHKEGKGKGRRNGVERERERRRRRWWAKICQRRGDPGGGSHFHSISLGKTASLYLGGKMVKGGEGRGGEHFFPAVARVSGREILEGVCVGLISLIPWMGEGE